MKFYRTIGFVGILGLTGMFIILCVSCKSFIGEAYGFNRSFPFKTTKEYFAYLQKSMGIDSGQVIYPDSKSLNMFYSYNSGDSFKVFCGTLLNDSMELAFSNSPGNLNCKGQMLEKIKSSFKVREGLLTQPSPLKAMRFHFLGKDSAVTFNSGDVRPKIILYYNYGFGTYFHKFIRKVKGYCSKSTLPVDLYILTTDYYELQRIKKIGSAG